MPEMTYLRVLNRHIFINPDRDYLSFESMDNDVIEWRLQAAISRALVRHLEDEPNRTIVKQSGLSA